MLQRQGKTLLATGKFEQAEDALETALAVDPRNRGAFVDLARVAEKQQLFGKAIRMTNKALALEPNDPDAIAVQGEAMVELGAIGARTGEPPEAADDLRQGLPAGRATLRRDQPRADVAVGRAAGARSRKSGMSSARASSTNSVDAERFGAPLDIDPELLRAPSAPETLEARSQHLAALAKGRRRDPLHDPRVDARGCRSARYGPRPRRPWAPARKPTG